MRERLVEHRYRDPRPTTKRGKVRIACMHAIEQHRLDGTLPTSIRFLFYELVARQVISKEGKRPDTIVSEAMTDLRKRGHIRWSDIVDETRSVENYAGSETCARLHQFVHA